MIKLPSKIKYPEDGGRHAPVGEVRTNSSQVIYQVRFRFLTRSTIAYTVQEFLMFSKHLS